MSPAIDVQILDDGTATATVTFDDAKGNAIPQPAGSTVAITSGDANVLVAMNADGLTATVTPAGPLVTGAVLTATATLADGATTFTATAAVDVVADASNPAGIALAVASA